MPGGINPIFFCGEGGERRRAEGSSGAPREALRKVRPPQRGFSRGYAPGFFFWNFTWNVYTLVLLASFFGWGRGGEKILSPQYLLLLLAGNPPSPEIDQRLCPCRSSVSRSIARNDRSLTVERISELTFGDCSVLHVPYFYTLIYLK